MTAEKGRETSVPPLEALRWHVEMGIDELIDDGPIDRYTVASKLAKTASAASPAVFGPSVSPHTPRCRTTHPRWVVLEAAR